MEVSKSTGSVSTWLRALKDGHGSAATNLYQRYEKPMRSVAAKSLGKCSRQVLDEEDVVIKAFSAFLRRTGDGAYPQLSSRADLWSLLATITKTQAMKQSRFFRRQKRNLAKQLSDSNRLLGNLASRRATPDVLASLSDTLSHLLAALEQEDKELVVIAKGRMEGFSNQEIAAQLNRSTRTVERRLLVIKSIWENLS